MNVAERLRLEAEWVHGEEASSAMVEAAERLDAIAAAADSFASGQISAGKLAEVIGCGDKHGFKTMAHAWCDALPSAPKGED